ncbi:MAG TPA: preprotein translocase subunit SecA, partial [Bacteroidales bacterium]|nr:preprotein translocase subunit SecA [Bacteroidales bacterium]
MGVFDSLMGKFFGKKSDRDIKAVMPIFELVKIEYTKIQNVSNDKLREISASLKNQIRTAIAADLEKIAHLRSNIEKDLIPFDQRESVFIEIDTLEKSVDETIKTKLDEILPTAFAIVRETARRFKENESIDVTANDNDRNIAATRSSVEILGSSAVWKNQWMAGGNIITWDMLHYDVQLIGGVVLHQGRIAEMGTGEGKTLVATLPVFLNALAGRGVHIVTVNDYLAKRDAEWMGPIFEFHGLTVDCIDKHQPNSDARRNAYLADITYGTNNEFGFDYLRDNMAVRPEDMVQRPHNYSIVDEVDSVLIDDARTPLIISGPIPRGDKQLFEEMLPKVVRLVEEQRKFTSQLLIDAKKLLADPKNEKGAIYLLRAHKGMPKNKALIKYLSESGMKALLHKTEDIYLGENAKRMPEITDDLFFVIDEKHNSVEMTDKGIDLITGASDDKKFFILPDIGSEIAELEKSALSAHDKLNKKDQLYADYAVKSERIHTINQLLKAYTVFEKDVEYVVIDNKVKIVDEQTGRIMEGRRYSDGLHQAIEAKENVKVEAATQTFATITLQNYFRMYKKLAGMTGTAETEAGELWDIYKLDVVVAPTNKPISRKDHHDLVYKTKREKYNAVIEEIDALTKAGRPILVGTTSVEISELLSRMLKMRGIKHNVLNAKLHAREADIVADAGKTSTVTIATNMAGRGTDIKLSKEVKEAGGLAIIGTERHESRRVDRQLRGRSGRQGDPGSSQFFVSLEDNLMRLFGSEKIARIMDRLGLEEGEVIQHSMISNSIERAQKKVEENNFGIRKRLLEYDDVMNSQREVIYKRRRHALYGERLGVDIANMMYDVSESIIEEMHGNDSFENLNMALITHLGIEAPFTEKDYQRENPNVLAEKVYETVVEMYKRRMDAMRTEAWPVIKQVYEKSAHQYNDIVVPITDNKREYQIVLNLEKAYGSECKEIVKAFEKAIILHNIDEAWKEHLREMDDLKQSVQNATYEQKDPLLIYKFESFNLFKTMLDRINKQILAILVRGHIKGSNPDQVQQARTQRSADMSRMQMSKSEAQSILSGGESA